MMFNIDAKPDYTYDAIVVGSGITGGWAAKELTERGLSTIMLERGRNVEHVKDYPTSTMNPWDYPHGKTISKEIAERHNVLSRRGLNAINMHFWADEQESPYVEKRRFDWYRGYQLGGRSLTWGRQSYRLSDLDFEANLKEGVGIDWPIRYRDIETWYSYVERFIGVNGNNDGLDILPDGDFLPPLQMNVVERDVAARIKQHYKGKRHLIIGRSANLTRPHNGRTNCQYQNQCSAGCNFGAYFSTQSSTLPAALATGRLTVRPFSIVTKILYDQDTGRATGVEVLDAETNLTYNYAAKVIFVCASALNSTWLLMNSATEIWEGGIGSSSGELGHNVMDHHFRCGASGTVVGFEDKYYYGRRPSGIYIPRFQNIGSDRRNYARGFGYQGSASRTGWTRDISEMSIGATWKDALCEPGNWIMGITGYGEILPYHDNCITLSKTTTDRWGLPVLEMDCELKSNELDMRKDMMEEGKQMLMAAGLEQVNAFDLGYGFGAGIHEMGTARMGRDPKTSVLNGNNQVWDAPNVFVTDGACMTSSGCVNPSLTYMALTARACAYAVNELKKLNL